MKNYENIGSRSKVGGLIHTALKVTSKATEPVTRETIVYIHRNEIRHGLYTRTMSDMVLGGLLTSSHKGYVITPYGRNMLQQIENRS